MPENDKELKPFDEYRLLILAHLERDEESIKNLNKEVQELRLEIRILKVKAGLWGALAGAVPGLIAILVTLIKVL